MADMLKLAVWLALLALSLFGAAGTLTWPAAWGAAAIYAGVVLIALATLDRDLIRERASPGKGFDRADARIASIGAVLFYPATLAACGLDHARDWTAALPSAAAIAGFAMFAGGYAVALAAMRANRFFSTFVRIQTDRGHQLVDRGPYAWVRHPGYSGTLLAHAGLPLALGALWGLLPTALGAAVFLARILREEQTLTAQLAGYEAYRHRVRWRLVPWVW